MEGADINQSLLAVCAHLSCVTKLVRLCSSDGLIVVRLCSSDGLIVVRLCSSDGLIVVRLCSS